MVVLVLIPLSGPARPYLGTIALYLWRAVVEPSVPWYGSISFGGQENVPGCSGMFLHTMSGGLFRGNSAFPLSAAAMHMAISEIICKLALNWIFCAQNLGIYSYVDSLKSNLYISYYLVLSRFFTGRHVCFLCRYIPGTYCELGYIWLNRGSATAYPPLPPLHIHPTTRTPS